MMILALLAVAIPADTVDLDLGGELLRVVASLFGIIVLILAAGWISRRMQRRAGSAGRRIRCVETFAVGTRDRLLLLDADGTRLLIGIGPSGMHTLHVYRQPSMEPPTAASAPLDASVRSPVHPFRELLQRWKLPA